MFIHILGSCSGTAPMAGRDYTSWILEEDSGKLLWFDAGGNCATHAYLKGLDPLKTGAFFLSHPHFDHTAGFQGIIAVIRKEKIIRLNKSFQTLHCYTATPQIIEGAFALNKLNSLDDEWDFSPEIHLIGNPGEIYRDDEVIVETLPNNHMPIHSETGKHRSWSFRIKCQKSGKNIVYTGDVKSLDELAPWLETTTTFLMLETGHHFADELCSQIRQRQWKVQELFFVHHGRKILNDAVDEKRKAEAIWGKPVLLAVDNMVLPLN